MRVRLEGSMIRNRYSIRSASSIRGGDSLQLFVLDISSFLHIYSVLLFNVQFFIPAFSSPLLLPILYIACLYVLTCKDGARWQRTKPTGRTQSLLCDDHPSS
ncbi:hypothetical protein BDZ91DRAFT_337277 [Kalaharituber pfeilii]|nr:hypothetical protein BDZ91DRAFT_337277 [Kalaharituber pfeilii]